jgi:hypothetical protein
MPGTYRRIYLDFNASTPTAPEVVDAMRMIVEGHTVILRAANGLAARRGRRLTKLECRLLGCSVVKEMRSYSRVAEVRLIITLSTGCSSQVERRMLTLLPPKWNIRR